MLSIWQVTHWPKLRWATYIILSRKWNCRRQMFTRALSSVKQNLQKKDYCIKIVSFIIWKSIPQPVLHYMSRAIVLTPANDVCKTLTIFIVTIESVFWLSLIRNYGLTRDTHVNTLILNGTVLMYRSILS